MYILKYLYFSAREVTLVMVPCMYVAKIVSMDFKGFVASSNHSFFYITRNDMFTLNL